MAGTRKLGKPTDQRLAMLKNQTTDLILNGKLVTTEARAKEVKAIADSIIALAVKEHKTMMNFDGLLYILGSIPMFIVTLVLLGTNFLMYAGEGMTKLELFENILRYLIPTFVLPISTAKSILVSL